MARLKVFGSCAGCGKEREIIARGLCPRCYDQDYLTRERPVKLCGCGGPHYAKGLCQKHYLAAYAQQNAAYERARARAWYANNRQRAIAACQIRKARRQERLVRVPSTLTKQQWEDIKAAYDYRCAYCWQRPQRLAREHQTPISRGGANTAANVVPACQSCNSRKGVKTLLEWAILQLPPGAPIVY